MLDSRVRMVLIALDRQTTEVPAHRVINPNGGNTVVVSCTLRAARKDGLAEVNIVRRIRYWRITDAGRAAIRS